MRRSPTHSPEPDWPALIAARRFHGGNGRYHCAKACPIDTGRDSQGAAHRCACYGDHRYSVSAQLESFSGLC